MKIRRYFRQPLIQAALLKLPDIADIPCEIRNFCQAGLLIKLTDPDIQKNLPRGQGGAEVVFTVAKTETPFRLEGRLSHVSHNGVGFVFDMPPPFQVLLALQEKSLPEASAKRDIPAELADIHRQCLQALENALHPLVEALPALIQDELSQQTGNTASSDPGQPSSGEAAAWAGQPFTQMVERFYAHVLEQAKNFVVPQLSLHPEAGAIYSESQSQRLVFEDWMNLIDKVILLESKYEDVLRLLEARFSILAQKDILSHDNPFGPSVLCHCFHYSLQGLSLGNPQRNLIYEIFTRLLDERLVLLYGELRSLSKPLDPLIKTKVEVDALRPFFFAGNPDPPPLKAPSKPEEAEAKPPEPLWRPSTAPSPPAATEAMPSPEPARWAAPATAAPPPSAKPERLPRPPDAFTAFVFLFRYAESQANKGTAETLGDFQRAAVIAALRKLQAGSPDATAPYFNAPRLQADLGQILSETGQAKILATAEARENLQLLGLLLDAMLGDMVIPPGATPYFKRLQIPLLITAFADPQFLHGNTHPGRDILNQLDYLTQAANPQGDIDNTELLRSLDAIFDRIADEVAGNPDVLVEALESLKKLTAPLIKAYAARVERVAESCEGGQRLEHARRRVDREVDARIGGKTVPSIVLALLDAGWRQALVLTCLRQGTVTDNWRRQLAVIDLLMGWLGKNPPSTPPNQFNIEWLIKFVKERLSDISADPSEAGRIVEKLKSLLLNGRGEANAPSYVEVPPADTTQEDKEFFLRERLQGFRAGDWLKIASARGPWVPLRLAWIGKNPARYVFVNRKGIKTLDLDAAKFVQFLDEKRASRMENLDELSLLERTAKSLLSTLRDRLR